VQGLVGYVQKHAGNTASPDGLRSASIRLRPDQKIVITRDWEDEKLRLRALRDVLRDIAGLVG
jgi:hypothetical protein